MIRLGAELEEIQYEGQPSSVYFGLPLYEKVDVQVLIDEAVTRGEKELTIPRGAYRITPKGAAHVVLKGLSDFTLHAEDVVFLYQDLATLGLLITDCMHLTIQGLSMDYEPCGWAQMKIEAIDPEGQFIDVSIDNGYIASFKDNELGCHEFQNMFFDGMTRRMMFLRPFPVTDQNVEDLGGRRFRVHSPLASDHRQYVRVGDYLCANMRKVMKPPLSLYRSGDVHIENVHVYSGTVGFVESMSPEKNYFNRFYDVPGPRPFGASEDRLCATDADGAHMTSNYVGATIENSVFHSLLDDGANFFGRYSCVAEVISPTEVVIAECMPLPFKAGEVLRLYDESSELIGDVTVVASEQMPEEYEPAVSAVRSLGVVTFRPYAYHRVTLDHAVELHEGFWINNTAHCSSGFVLRNNIYCNLRPRGALIKASHGIIENCLFEDVGRHGVQISPELHWSEAGYSDDIVVRGNLFVRVGAGNGVAVTVEGHAARDQRNILIEGNRFVDCPNGDLRLTSCNGVTVRDNEFGIGNLRNIGVPAITLGTASNVRLENNIFADRNVVPLGAGSLAEGVVGANVSIYSISSVALNAMQQGADGWHFGYAPIGEHTYTDYPVSADFGSRVQGWKGEEEESSRFGSVQTRWGSTYMHPGEDFDCVKTYVCPKDGRVRLGSPSTVIMGGPTEDGVILQILVGETLLWETEFGQNAVIHAPRLELDVRAGNAIHFRVNKNGNAESDGITWDPAVLYLS